MCDTYNYCQMWESAVAEGRIGPNICPRALLCCNFVSVWAGYCCSHSVNFYPQIEFYTKSSRDSCLTKHQHNHSIWWGMYPIPKSSAFTKLALHFVYKLRATAHHPPARKKTVTQLPVIPPIPPYLKPSTCACSKWTSVTHCVTYAFCDKPS